MLARVDLVDEQIAASMQSMVGLRNIAVHDYQTLNLDIVIHVVIHYLDDFSVFLQQVAQGLANREKPQD